MRSQKNRKSLIFISQAGVIGALYTVLTVLIGPFGSAVIQCRVSEALCVLPFFTPAAIPGLTVGCIVSNLLTGGLWQDVVFGSLATLIGAAGAYLLRKFPCLVPLPTVIANTLIVPMVLAWAYQAEEGLPFLMVTVGVGEVISAYVLGMLLLTFIRKNCARLFDF